METINDLMELVNACGIAKSNKEKVPAAKETADLLAELGFRTAALNVERRLRPAIKMAEISALGYVEITPDKIQEFLKRKAKQYNDARPAKKRIKEIGNLLNTATYNEYVHAGNTVTWDMYTTTTTTSYAPGQLITAQNAASNGYASLLNQNLFGIGALGSGSEAKAGTMEVFSIKTADFSSVEPGTIGQFKWTEVRVEDYAGIPPLEVLRKLKNTIAQKVFDYFSVASVNAVRDPLLLGRVEDSDSRFFVAQWGDDVSLDDVI